MFVRDECARGTCKAADEIAPAVMEVVRPANCSDHANGALQFGLGYQREVRAERKELAQRTAAEERRL
jgi:hypothetical protein